MDSCLSLAVLTCSENVGEDLCEQPPQSPDSVGCSGEKFWPEERPTCDNPFWEVVRSGGMFRAFLPPGIRFDGVPHLYAQDHVEVLIGNSFHRGFTSEWNPATDIVTIILESLVPEDVTPFVHNKTRTESGEGFPLEDAHKPFYQFVRVPFAEFAQTDKLHLLSNR